MRTYKFYMSVDQEKPGSEEKLKVQCLASQHFEAFTIYNSVNFWSDKHERGLVIEVITGESTRYQIETFARSLKALIKQEHVLITSHEVTGDLI
jgi:hypothetical protein